MKKALMIGILWIVIAFLGLAAIELCLRKLMNYRLFSLPLIQAAPGFGESERLKIYNRRFYEQNPGRFNGWPIELELFEADGPTPRYRFKPKARFKRVRNRLLPAGERDEVFWASNSLGFRGEEISREKPEGTIRIVCLGGSTTEGSHGQYETYPHYLEQEVERRHPQKAFDVVNAGHHALKAHDLLEVLKTRLLPLSPDVLIYYQAHNNVRFWEFIGPMACVIGDEANCWLQVYPAWWQLLYLHSATFAVLADRLGWDNTPRPPMEHEFVTENDGGRTAYREALEGIVRVCRENGLKLLLSPFVTIVHPGFDITPEMNALIYDDVYRKWYPLTPAELSEIYGIFNSISAEVAEMHGVPYAAPLADYPREVRYFSHDIIHFSPEGNKLLASMFADELERGVLAGQFE